MNPEIRKLKMKETRILVKLTAPWGINEHPSDVEAAKMFHKVWKEKIEPIRKRIEEIKKEDAIKVGETRE